jgi:hypothetical protein
LLPTAVNISGHKKQHWSCTMSGSMLDLRIRCTAVTAENLSKHAQKYYILCFQKGKINNNGWPWIKQKIKIFLFLMKAPRLKVVWESGGKAVRVFNYDTRRK